MTRALLLAVAVPFFLGGALAQEENPIELLIRCDDSGMSHSANMALEELCETGLPFSTSVMFACPWYQEAVDILKENPHVSAGVHLTLNAEWKNFRWGPVAGVDRVPTLVDSTGHFTPSRGAFNELEPKIEEIEIELRAQIERALATGLRIDYVDYHMGTAVETPERRALVERLADEYGLAISRYYAERDVESMYAEELDEKLDRLLTTVEELDADSTNLLVCHIIADTPEARALEDLNKFGLEHMSRHRQAELNALASEEFKLALDAKGVRLLTYRDLVDRLGVEGMIRTEVSGY